MKPGKETITIICITAITCAVIYLNPDFSKDVTLTALGGLIGYLSRESAVSTQK